MLSNRNYVNNFWRQASNIFCRLRDVSLAARVHVTRDAKSSINLLETGMQSFCTLFCFLVMLERSLLFNEVHTRLDNFA